MGLLEDLEAVVEPLPTIEAFLLTLDEPEREALTAALANPKRFGAVPLARVLLDHGCSVNEGTIRRYRNRHGITR